MSPREPATNSTDSPPGDPDLRRAILSSSLARVHEQVAAACRRAGRSPGDVRLVAVTKYVEADVIRLMLDLGAIDLGENRVQQLGDRASQVGGLPIGFDVTPSLGVPRWHMIGHLQRNKVKALLRCCAIVHSLDSTRLAEELSLRAAEAGTTIDALIEVNVAGEAAKSGASIDDAVAIARLASTLPALRIRGLMTMAPFGTDAQSARPFFRRLRELRDEWLASGLLPPNAQNLSMGMSHDFESAIEEGATIVRIGSALFEGLMPEH